MVRQRFVKIGKSKEHEYRSNACQYIYILNMDYTKMNVLTNKCRRTSPNVAANCHSHMELRPPTARKNHPNFFAHCKRSTNMKKYVKNMIPNAQNTMRTQVAKIVSNYGQ